MPQTALCQLSLELALSVLPIWHNAIEKFVECSPMIVIAKMTQLMRNDVVDCIYRGPDQRAIEN
jgi:hypothetical protein